MTTPLISVCVPVYNGSLYVKETLDRIYSQTYKNLEILISVDLSTDNTLEICKRLKNENTKIFEQNIRLGWVKNCNFLISQSSGKYFSIIPHDDLIENDYFEKLLAGFEKYPNAVNCFPRIICFGTHIGTLSQSNITGTVQNRINDVINKHINSISFRGLVKKDLPHDLLYLREDQPGNILADSIWILQHAIAGELYSIDVPYHKRHHATNEHSTWKHKSLNERISSWIYHCATLYELSKDYVDDKTALYNICKDRLFCKKLNIGYIPLTNIDELICRFEEKINV